MVLVIFQLQLENCTVIQCLWEEKQGLYFTEQVNKFCISQESKGTLILLSWAFDGSVTEQMIV